MNKEEYKKEIEAIQAQRSAIDNQEHELRKKYINSNKEFEVGDRVAVHFKAVWNDFTKKVLREEHVEFGYVKSIYISFSGEICYSLYQEKKDGTPSTRKVDLWGKRREDNYTIQKAEKQ